MKSLSEFLILLLYKGFDKISGNQKKFSYIDSQVNQPHI